MSSLARPRVAFGERERLYYNASRAENVYGELGLLERSRHIYLWRFSRARQRKKKFATSGGVKRDIEFEGGGESLLNPFLLRPDAVQPRARKKLPPLLHGQAEARASERQPVASEGDGDERGGRRRRHLPECPLVPFLPPPPPPPGTRRRGTRWAGPERADVYVEADSLLLLRLSAAHGERGGAGRAFLESHEELFAGIGTSKIRRRVASSLFFSLSLCLCASRRASRVYSAGGLGAGAGVGRPRPPLQPAF